MSDMTTRLRVILVTIAVSILLAAAGGWWFFKDDAPDEVSLANAVESVTEDSSADSSTTVTVESDSTVTTDAGGAESGIDGTWTVDSESGAFDYESATGTFVGFRIEEELASIGSTTAVGRTGDVDGSITVEGTTITTASFEVDLTSITTNESRRDDKVQSALDTSSYRTATFTLTEPITLPDGAASGEAVQVTAVGDLTIHGVTQTIELPIEAQLVEGTIVLVGSVDVTFSDFDVEVPSSQIVVSVEDHGVLELQLLLVQT